MLTSQLDKPTIEAPDGILGNNDNSDSESSLSVIEDKKEVPELKAIRQKSEYALVKDVSTVGPSGELYSFNRPFSTF